MQLNITGHHVDITDSMRDYVTSKLERLERHFDS
ncbi:MAG: ribosome-associated translation inhibitor RaiA, partial [Gammaproteobacteria bacterium]|nr:ribosome-associated translation inhibitor RaiA [Gammaproteobacteria bacterium]